MIKLNKIPLLFCFIVLPFLSQAQVVWTEFFGNCSVGCTPNSYVGANGAWNFNTTLGLNDPDANLFYASDQENGNASGACGSSLGGNASLHIASTISGDNGALYNAGGLCAPPINICVTTDVRAESPTINLTGFSNLKISFNYMENGDFNLDDADFWYFDGVTWSVLDPLAKTSLACGAPFGTWTRIVLSLPASANNNANVKIGYRWVNNDDGFGTDPSFAVDSIVIFAKPVAMDDNTSTPAATAVIVNVLANDIPNPGLNTTAVPVAPAHGTTVINAAGTITYTPNAGYCGMDSFMYVVADNSAPPITDTAWVFVAVGNIPSAPGGVTANSPVCVGDTIFLSCTPAAGASVQWTGPNSFSSTNVSPSILNATAASSGTYSVVQFLSAGCNSAASTINVTVNPNPVINLIANNNPICMGATLNLTATTIAGATYSWTGPNNPIASVTNTCAISPVVGADSGTYTVIVDLVGCIDTASLKIDTIQCPIPTAAFTTINDTFCSGVAIQFTDASTNTPTNWLWDFNKTNIVNITASPINSIIQNPTCTYTNNSGAPITVTVELTPTNAFGSGGAITHTLVIMPPAPTAVFSYLPAQVCSGASVNFSSASSTNSPSTWSWTFGSGLNAGNPATSSSQNVNNVVFNNIGNSVITLTETNYCGSNTFTQSINVTSVPVANFNFTSGTLCNNSPVQFNNNTIGGATSYLWDFGDSQTSVLANPSHVYAAAGNYNVTLTVTNSCGNSLPVTQTVTIVNCLPPVAGFIIPDSFCMNYPITIQDTSKNVGTNSIYYWIFNGGNPATSNLANPTVTYNTNGWKTVTLIVQNLYGIDSVKHQIYIKRCLPPVPGFLLQEYVCQGFCVDIVNISTEGPYTCNWTFDGADSLTSTQENPTHICYQNPGVYAVTLVVTNQYGFNTYTQNIIVSPSPQILTPNTLIEAGNSLTLEAVPAVGTHVTWSPTQFLSAPDSNITQCTPTVPIWYTVSDSGNCPSPDTVYITIDYRNTKISIPNTFTPDGNGFNDVFRIKSNIPLINFELIIFNRWGERVFDSKDQTVGWDGTYLGKQLNSDVFVYNLFYRDLGSNEYKSQKGSITLLR